MAQQIRFLLKPRWAGGQRNAPTQSLPKPLERSHLGVAVAWGPDRLLMWKQRVLHAFVDWDRVFLSG